MRLALVFTLCLFARANASSGKKATGKKPTGKPSGGGGGGGGAVMSKALDWKIGMSKPEQMAVLRTDGKKPAALTFKWGGSHNVFQFTDKAAFEKCDFKGAKNLGAKSPVTFSTAKPGIYFFGCEVTGHCGAGQKVMLKVTAGDGDYSDYTGVRIKKEKSLVSFGPKEDVKLVRMGPRLQVVAPSVHVPANFNVGEMSIEDLIVKTVMDKIKPRIALCQDGFNGPWCSKQCPKKNNQYFTSGFKAGKNCGVATCGTIASCAKDMVTCKSATTQQCGKCNNGYYLTKGVKDKCTKCPTGYSCDGSIKKTLADSSRLVDLGGSAHTKGKLAKCQGDCDNDSQCATGLKCFQRDKSSQAVPGCFKGGKGDIGTHDYCYDPTPLQDLGGSAHTKGKLDKCQGDCDSDSHCMAGLKCFQRDKSSQIVPGCPAGGSGDIGSHDYCYQPADVKIVAGRHTEGMNMGSLPTSWSFKSGAKGKDNSKLFDGNLKTGVGGDSNKQHDELTLVQLNEACKNGAQFKVYGRDLSHAATALRHIRTAYSANGNNWKCYTKGNCCGLTSASTSCGAGSQHGNNGMTFTVPGPVQYFMVGTWGRTEVFEIQFVKCT